MFLKYEGTKLFSRCVMFNADLCNKENNLYASLLYLILMSFTIVSKYILNKIAFVHVNSYNN